MSKKFYRPEIDGLRALAIIPVVLFHAGVVGFSGGFVGVDIFFVISGYLITSVILRDIAQHTFSLRTFYARRIRRLLPALFVFLTVTTIFAYLFLKYPGDLESYGASLFAQSLFLSNFYFSGLGDYFGTPVEVLPLLHTWSLSLEEQFYFIFPFLLFFFYKYKRHILKPLLYTLIILSLLYCIYLTNFSPTSPFSPPLLPDLWRGASNLTSAFFLLPTRLWELLLGAVLALPTLRITHIPLAQVLGGGGAIMVMVAVFFFDSNTLFPGYATLLPTLGATFIILAGTVHPTLITRALATRPLVWVGLISYSLYLWHWPVIVFAKTLIPKPTPLVMVLCILLSFVLAGLSYVYIETPFRERFRLSTTWTLIVGPIAMVFLVALGYTLKNATHDAVSQPTFIQPLLDAADTQYLPRACAHTPFVPTCDLGNATDTNTPYTFVLWGDSHAEMYYPVLDQMASSSNIRGKYFVAGGCEPIPGVTSRPRDEKCETLKQNAYTFILENNVQHVIIIARWDLYINGVSHDNKNEMVTYNAEHEKTREEAITALHTHVPNMLAKLQNSGVKVYLFQQIPVQHYFDARQIFYRSIHENSLVDIPVVSLTEHRKRQQFMDTIMQHATDSGITIIDPTPALCPDDWCMVTNKDGFLYRDTNHLTLLGAQYVRNALFDEITFFAKQPNPH